MEELTWTSTGVKIIHHPDVVERFRYGQIARPISLQIAPTSRCNLRCEFCSNINRENSEDLDADELMDFLLDMKELGLKTVEWTGGGDPVLYERINEVMEAAKVLGLKQGLITNGLLLEKKINKKLLQSLCWIRVSMNGLDYGQAPKLPDIKGTLGFSYVMNEKTTGKVRDKLIAETEFYKPSYVRIVPNCQATDKEQKENNFRYSQTVSNWGKPFFYQGKSFSRPERCWWGHFKPFLLHDGYIYPCSSVVLNLDADRKFNEKYRWVKMWELLDKYKKKAVSYNTENCDHCVFRMQNDLMDSIINPTGMEDFV